MKTIKNKEKIGKDSLSVEYDGKYMAVYYFNHKFSALNMHLDMTEESVLALFELTKRLMKKTKEEYGANQ